MTLLLDTHVWLWRLLEPSRVAAAAEDALADPTTEVRLSVISLWETLVLVRKGRIEVQASGREWVLDALRRSGPTTLPLTASIAIGAESLHGFGSADPADRFIVATALEHDLTLVTADAAMLDHTPVRTLAAR